MNGAFGPWLAGLLFLPWFLILGVLFWCYPRRPRNAARRIYDALALLAAALVFATGVRWAYADADAGYGAMWRQVYATSVGYGLFLAALLLAFVVRRQWLRARGGEPPAPPATHNQDAAPGS